MQPKISSFFKLKSPPDLASPPEPQRPQISVTYSRRASNIQQTVDGGVGSGICGEENVLVVKSKEPVGRSLNKKRSYAQLHLELGQSNFLLHSCSICGLKYAPGEVDDEKMHKTYHKNYTHGLPFKGWSNERVFETSSTPGRILLVLDGDPPSHISKVQDILKLMENDLGDSGIYHKNCKVYLYILSQRVAGCVVAEPIDFAHKILSRCVNKNLVSNAVKEKKTSATLQFGSVNFRQEVVRRSSSVNDREVLNGNYSGAIICESEPVLAACGIRAVWVTPLNRRKHIATELLNVVRESFAKGLVLEKSQIAFAQPTSDGKALAVKYTGLTSFLVY